ncbi:MAG: hypothetical protein DMG13_31555 [Acidobacteria bacterium]|nr:MAG: hypothetical protein DMG13_31555 [Acidobacteriota bacterium]
MTQSKTIAVEYSLTQLGMIIITPLEAMCRWAKRYLTDVSADVRPRVINDNYTSRRRQLHFPGLNR